jgi:hypothetical protein
MKALMIVDYLLKYGCSASIDDFTENIKVF